MKRIFLWSALLLLSLALPKNSFAQEIDFDQIPLEAFKPEVKSAADSVLLAIDQDAEKAGKEAFAEFLRKYRKDGDQMYRAARYFMEKDKYYCAEFCLKQANAIYDKHLEVLRLKVELYSKLGTDANEVGAGFVGGAYDEILRVDSTNVDAIRGIAFVNRYQNPWMCIEYYEKLLKKIPDDSEAYKIMGMVYHRMDSIKLAIKNYDKYYKVTTVDSIEEYHVANYITDLYLEKKYNQLIKICKAVEPRFPKNKQFKANKFWALTENLKKDIADMQLSTADERAQMYRMLGTDAEAAMSYVTNKEFADSLYGYWDYAYVAELNDGQGKYKEAVEYQKLALEKDTTRAAAYQLMSQYLQDNKQYKDALPYYKEYMRKMENLNRGQLKDTVRLGVLFQDIAAHETDSTEFFIWVNNADSIYSYVSDRESSHLGPMYRARIASQLARPNQNGEVDLNPKARKLYKEVLLRIGDNEGFNTNKWEALQYLAQYYIFNEKARSYRKALEYFLELEKLDSKNEWVKDMIPRLQNSIATSPQPEEETDDDEQAEEQSQEQQTEEQLAE